MRRFFTLALVVATAAIPSIGQATDVGTYVAGIGDLTTVNCDGQDAPGAPGLGGSCFQVPDGSTYATLTIADAHGEPVAGQFYFANESGSSIAGTHGILCGGRTVPVPDTAVSMTVYIDTVFAQLDCGLLAQAGTTGTISVDWVEGPDPAGVNATEGSGSPNITPLANIRYPVVSGWPWPGGTDLEFFNAVVGGTEHRFVVAGSYQNGMRIIDVTDPADPVVVSTYDCRIYQADIQIFERDGKRYVAYAVDDYSRTDIGSACFRDLPEEVVVRYGTFIIDITDPAAPQAVSFIPFSQGSHNVTVGFYLYSSNADLPGTGTVEIFDITDLEQPEVAQMVDLGATLPSHDVTFSEDGTRAYVAALTSTIILDTTDVANPVVVGRIVDPSINIHHQADPITITDPILGTRTFVVITDEIGGAEGNGACPGGGLHVYDVTGDLEATPVPVGFFDLPDTRTVTHRLRCTAHVMRMYPEQQLMTIAWYNAGVRVLDLSALVGVSIGAAPSGSLGMGIKQVGWFAFDRTDTWAVKAPVDGFEPDGSFTMYASDQLRGFDVYRFDAGATPSAEKGRWLDADEVAASIGPRAPLAVEDLRLACVIRPAVSETVGR
jgi:hypothetical protein